MIHIYVRINRLGYFGGVDSSVSSERKFQRKITMSGSLSRLGAINICSCHACLRTRSKLSTTTFTVKKFLLEEFTRNF